MIYASTPGSRQSVKNVENCCLVVCTVHCLNLLRAGCNCACVCVCGGGGGGGVGGAGGRERGKREKQTHRERQADTHHRERWIEGRGKIGVK